jgi:hypothetical protein
MQLNRDEHVPGESVPSNVYNRVFNTLQRSNIPLSVNLSKNNSQLPPSASRTIARRLI